ncbi:MAG: HNH endonuclease signature motif containing protein [Pseudomonadota bacterium]
MGGLEIVEIVRYWWVNQNQTYRHEVSGSYLWSPKRKADGSRNPFYEFMREVSPGDLILSFSDTYIRAIGVARSYCYECPKPAEFGRAGAYWDQIGWKVDVSFHILHHQIRPSDHMAHLAPLLPEKYSPLLESGRGSQAIYLTEIQPVLMAALSSLIGHEASLLMSGNHLAQPQIEMDKQPALGLDEWEEHLQQKVREDAKLGETEKAALVMARRGQGTFRLNVSQLERKCRITQVDRPEHLRASHIKPWRDCTNQERLEGENGFLLTPSIDHLFDRGFISFEDNGQLLISPVAHKLALQRMGVDTNHTVNVGSFTTRQKQHLDFHRNYVFLESRRI